METIKGHIKNIFGEVRNYVKTKGYAEVEKIKINPKGKDISTKFDLTTERIAIDYCKRNSLSVRILSEESGEINLCDNPKWIFVIDPVDGSTNLKKGIEGSAFSIAVLPNGKIEPKNVQYALIGSITTGSFCFAEKDEGTSYQGFFNNFAEKKVSTSKNKNLETACLEIDLDFALNEATDKINLESGKKIERILPLIYPVRQIKHIRRGGSAAIGLMEVATGAVDAYVDARDSSTPENWLAAYLLIKEAGGIFTDLNGKKIAEIKNLITPYSFVASGNPTLHKKILKRLNL